MEWIKYRKGLIWNIEYTIQDIICENIKKKKKSNNLKCDWIS